MSHLAIRENVPLAPYTTLGVGGPARFLAEPHTEEDLLAILDFAARKEYKIFVLGGGSNVVVSDAGFPGLVLRVALRGVQEESGGCSCRLRAAAGEDWDAFVSRCVAAELGGVECLSGIPGTVGGTPVQNVGAYGQEVSESIRSVRAVDRTSLKVVELNAPDCRFAYRSSIFNSSQLERYVVLAVTYELSRHYAPRLQYADLQRHFAGAAAPPTLAEVRRAVLEIRRRKGMLLIAGDPDARSAGSFFKNPLLSARALEEVEARARSSGALGAAQSMPSFPADGGQAKIPAAWLIEHAGFTKGCSDGQAGLSTKHALAIVNRGGARSEDILRLMRKVQRAVRSAFGVELAAEPVFVGFEQE
jgi:UDP-N-acetylmuramate dehydrogenase